MVSFGEILGPPTGLSWVEIGAFDKTGGMLGHPSQGPFAFLGVEADEVVDEAFVTTGATTQGVSVGELSDELSVAL